MKKHDHTRPLSIQELDSIYPKALTYEQKQQREQRTIQRREAARPTFPALRIAVSMSSVVAFWILSIRLGAFFFSLTIMTGVCFSLLLFVMSIGAVVVLYSYIDRLFGYQNCSTGGFFASYAIVLFIVSGVASSFGWADLLKIALSPAWIGVLVLFGHTVVTYILAGIYVGYRR